MKNVLFPLSILCFLVSSCSKVQDTEKVKTTDKPVSDTERAINHAVLDAYKVLEFDLNNPQDFEGMRDVFVENPTFMNFRNDSLEMMTLDRLILDLQAMARSGEMLLFQENEIGGTTEYFGKIAHRISSYETFVNTLDTAAERGVNSFQLIKIDGKWLVSSIIWDVERESLPIPEKYL